MSKRMMDIVDDLWTIFECPECGVLFFSEDRIYQHLQKTHKIDFRKVQVYSMEFIRAVPQNKNENINDEINP